MIGYLSYTIAHNDVRYQMHPALLVSAKHPSLLHMVKIRLHHYVQLVKGVSKYFYNGLISVLEKLPVALMPPVIRYCISGKQSPH